MLCLPGGDDQGKTAGVYSKGVGTLLRTGLY
jgi:hypothetical protein